MGFLEIIVIALGLSMDAFAVSITLGLSLKNPTIKERFIPGTYFGLFQALMPLAGYFAGILFASKVQDYAHWVTLILLGIIGGKMIRESFSKNKDAGNNNVFKVTTMLLLAFATSIDALAVGVTFAFFDVNIFAAIMAIGLITFGISVLGMKIGSIVGVKFKSKAERMGGIVLVLIGVKIFVEHLML